MNPNGTGIKTYGTVTVSPEKGGVTISGFTFVGIAEDEATVLAIQYAISRLQYALGEIKSQNGSHNSRSPW